MSRLQYMTSIKPLPKSLVEGVYHDIDKLSYSKLKLYDEDRKKYKLLYVDKDPYALLEKEKDKEKSPFIRMGNLVDIRLTDPDEYKNKFAVASAKVPTGQMLKLCDHLYDVTISDTVDGEILTSFEVRFGKAYTLLKEENGGKLQSKVTTMLENFVKEGEEYFQEKLRNRGKTLVSPREESISENLANSLMYSEATSKVVNHKDKIIKFAIFFKVGELEFKMELDQGNFDHENKVLYPFDYKVTSFIEDFVWKSYLESKYYIQAGLYRFGLEQWIQTVPEYADYRVENMAFIVADFNNYYTPLIYQTNDLHYEQAWIGFKVGNKRYNGISQIIDDLQFSVKDGSWNISPENYRKKGRILIPTFSNID